MAKKTLTLDALLDEKKVTKPKKWTFDSDELSYTIEIEKILPSKITNILAGVQDNSADEYTTYLMLIYESVPIFKAKELQKKYAVAEPFEIVDAIFDRNLGEIYALGNQICANYGFGNEAKEDIKKQ
jgi:hypothetical protein